MENSMDRLRQSIEATRLGFGLTEDAIEELIRSAGALGVRGVCVPGCFVSSAVAAAADLPGWDPEIVTVANFPTGDHGLEQVREQAQRAGRDGADHLDVVVPGRFVLAGQWRALYNFIRCVRTEFEGGSDRSVAVKVILEAAALDDRQIRGAAGAAIDAGARWLKTSTGFHPRGGATEASVGLLRSIAPPEVGVKASGGIRTAADALRMLDAGADRIGTSAERVILGG